VWREAALSVGVVHHRRRVGDYDLWRTVDTPIEKDTALLNSLVESMLN